MKKLLVWDCDETLWKGTLIAGDSVTLFPGRVALIKELRGRGVAQSIASANRLEDVMEVLAAMQIDDLFLYPQASLTKSKPEMIATIRDSLGLSRWSDIVFVDDNPAQREEVRMAFEGIEVVDPARLDYAVDYLFTKDHYTEEDRLRVRRYEQERIRKSAETSYTGDRTKFLHSLEMEVEFSVMKDEDTNRVIQLIERANRMSAIAKTFKVEELGKYNTYVLRVKDKFGDYGLSGLVVTSESAKDKTLFIEALVVSCRLQGKGIGTALVSFLVEKARSHKLKYVEANWVGTEYNTGFEALYSYSGFLVHKKGDKFRAVCNLEVSKKDLTPPWINANV